MRSNYCQLPDWEPACRTFCLWLLWLARLLFDTLQYFMYQIQTVYIWTVLFCSAIHIAEVRLTDILPHPALLTPLHLPCSAVQDKLQTDTVQLW